MALPKKKFNKKKLNGFAQFTIWNNRFSLTKKKKKTTYGGNQKVVILSSIFWSVIHKPNGQDTTKKEKISCLYKVK